MTKFEEILIKAEELSKIEDFDKKVNNRPFEIEITKIASSYRIDEELKTNLIEKIKSSYATSKKLSFVLFFILFTICRRQNYGNFLELVEEYEQMFNEYVIIKHIRVMAAIEKCTNTKNLYREVKMATLFIESKGDNYDFSVNTGALNAYCGLVCKYFEYQLDKRDDSDNHEYLDNALECINRAIEIETKEKGSPDLVYNKFYLNRGRVLILLKKYSKGEEDILKSIELLPASVDRESKINEYNQYLVKSSITRAYDLNEEKVKDLDKLKVSNYKSIALMTTLLGFLLGAINIFTEIKDPFTLAMLMLGYCGLLLVLIGTILLGFSLNFKERKTRLYIYDVLLILVGVIVFASSMIIIINK